MREIGHMLVVMDAVTFYPPSTTFKGDIETVSVRPSFRSKRKSSYSDNFSPILTKFLQHVYVAEKFYNMQFLKKFYKLLPWQPFFFLSFNAYLSMFFPYMKA